MSRSVSFSDFVSFDKHFASTSSEEKLEGIFKLFDNNNEGILRRHEVRKFAACNLLFFNLKFKVDIRYIFCFTVHCWQQVSDPRQIIFSLYLIKQKEIKVKVIEDVVEKVMKTKKKSNFGYISLDDFIKNAFNVAELKEILQ